MTRLSTIAAMLALALPAVAQAGTVAVDLSGLRAGGTLYVQLQTREQFMGPGRAAGQIVQAPPAGALSLDLGEVPAGDYAVTVWHDDNGNGRFDVDPRTGAPADGWASANAETLRDQPTFDQIRLTVPASGSRIPLALRYGR
ncbi:MAG TPA: DUF2141 domain-containing protein [Allosphingosinicella sp.]|nr:DUF2141 domain-containing protein [Allosphingosinicella sp.]